VAQFLSKGKFFIMWFLFEVEMKKSLMTMFSQGADEKCVFRMLYVQVRKN
jgi:hypothetical protein